MYVGEKHFDVEEFGGQREDEYRLREVDEEYPFEKSVSWMRDDLVPEDVMLWFQSNKPILVSLAREYLQEVG